MGLQLLDGDVCEIWIAKSSRQNLIFLIHPAFCSKLLVFVKAGTHFKLSIHMGGSQNGGIQYPKWSTWMIWGSPMT